MARGHSRHSTHHNLGLFGKDLVRRCSAHCELCDAQGVKLKIYEVPPIPADAMLDHCIMICETCYEQIEKPKRLDTDHWRCLYNSIWNKTPAVKVAALAMLDQVAEREAWAAELREQAYMEPEEEAWLEELEAL